MAVFLYVAVALCAAWYAGSAVVVPHAYPTAVVSWLLSLVSCQVPNSCRMSPRDGPRRHSQSPVSSNAQLLVQLSAATSVAPPETALLATATATQQHSSGYPGTEPGNTDSPLAQRN